jgi:hypothetical protein
VSVRLFGSLCSLWRLKCADAHHDYRYLDTGTNRRPFTTSWCTSHAARLTLTILLHMAAVMSLPPLQRARPDHATAVPTLDCRKLRPTSPACCCLNSSDMSSRFRFDSCNMDIHRLPRSRKPQGLNPLFGSLVVATSRITNWCGYAIFSTILWAPLQQLAQVWRTGLIAVSSHVKVSPRSFLGPQRTV